MTLTKLLIQATPSGERMQQYPPPEQWADWVVWDQKAWP